MIHMVQIDAATGEIVHQQSWKSNLKSMDDRMNVVVEGLEVWLKENKVTGENCFAAVEDPIYIQNAKATIGIASVIAGVKHSMYAAGVDCMGIGNRSWKKVVIGKGNATKDEIMEFAEARWGKVFPEQDYADAACVSLWGKMAKDTK